MRLLIFGHYSHTGFGVVTESLGARFRQAGIDLRVIAVNHRGEPVTGPLSGRVWPANLNGDGFGASFNHLAIDGTFWKQFNATDDWKPDVGLVIADVSGLKSYIGQRVNPQWSTIPILHYCPIEGDNLAPSWRDVWGMFQPVAMSEYGRTQIAEHIGRDVPMIYHGVHTETFRPVSVTEPFVFDNLILRTKEDCKRAFGFDPARKLVLRADRAVQRKFYDVTLRAMSEVFDRDPLVDLVLHCSPVDEGYVLYEDLARLPAHQMQPGSPRVKLTMAHDTFVGLPEGMLVALYNAADVYLTTTSGEGFGLTIAEALACEVPVVSTGWAAEVEVVGPGGILVPPIKDEYGETVRYHSTYGMDWAIPDPKGFVEPVLGLLAKPQRARAIGKAGRHHVIRSFNWDRATDQFIALFAQALEAAEVAA